MTRNVMRGLCGQPGIPAPLGDKSAMRRGAVRGMAGFPIGIQTTLRRPTGLSGIGVHSGEAVSLVLHPAEADTGIRFHRTLPDDGRECEIPADYRYVDTTELCTTVGIGGASVATIEHLMATLSGLSIDNVIVEIDGPEVPVMDGSANPFIDAIDQVGVAVLAAPRRYIRVLKPVRVEIGDGFGEFRPYGGMRIEVEIDFANPLVGHQTYAADVDGERFRKEIARARTFGFLADVEMLWARGFALGASLENAVVIADDRVVNPEGLRFADEFVRHKALDAIGDIALAGAPILGCYRSFKGGHRLNIKALAKLLSDATAYEVVELPVRREVGHADLSAGVGVAAYGPDVS
jgi:UDP-3-O-[3-hydroxymyristoyl] N-acetylglucosamine deacetylase